MRPAEAGTRSARRSCRWPAPWLRQSALRCFSSFSMWRSSASRDGASMIGPMSVSGSAGSPTLSSASAPARRRSTRGAAPSSTNRMRCAEQRWPALWNAETTTSSTTCSGSAEASTIMALTPPVSAISGTIGPSRCASARLMRFAVSTEPVKATPAMRGSRDQRRADGLAVADHAARGVGAGCRPRSRISTRTQRDARRLLGGLGDHGVAGGERGGDLAGEDGEREVPRADAGEHAAAVQAQLVALAGGPGKEYARRNASSPGQRSSGRSPPPRAPPTTASP